MMRFTCDSSMPVAPAQCRNAPVYLARRMSYLVMDWLSISNGFMHDAVVIHTDTTDERFFSKSLDSTDAADFTGDDTMPFRDCGVGVNRVRGVGS